jgi:hypothetical protein
MEKKSVDAVIKSAKDTLGAPVLLRCVWTREAQNHAIRQEERAQCVIVEFPAIISLQASNGSAELSTNIGMKANDSGQDFRFISQWKRPNIMGMIIKNHNVILVTRIANHWRGPHITMQKLKRSAAYII